MSVWKIDNNLGQVIKYTTDKEKTDLDNYSDLEKSLEYIKDEFKKFWFSIYFSKRKMH